MPYLVTEPQRIEGTNLGFSVYPYHHSFDDHIDTSSANQKLLIFQLKNSKFIEVDHIVHEEGFKYQELPSGYVRSRLKDFVGTHPEYISNPQQVSKYFDKTVINTK